MTGFGLDRAAKEIETFFFLKIYEYNQPGLRGMRE